MILKVVYFIFKNYLRKHLLAQYKCFYVIYVLDWGFGNSPWAWRKVSPWSGRGKVIMVILSRVRKNDEAPYIFLKKSNVVPMPRSIALLFLLASNISLAFTLHLSKEIDASRFFGAREMFCWREKYSTLKKSTIKNSTLKIFNVEKVKRWKSIVGNFNVGKFIVENFQRRQQFNVEMHQGQTIFTVRNFISCRRVWKLLDTILGSTLRC